MNLNFSSQADTLLRRIVSKMNRDFRNEDSYYCENGVEDSGDCPDADRHYLQFPIISVEKVPANCVGSNVKNPLTCSTSTDPKGWTDVVELKNQSEIVYTMHAGTLPMLSPLLILRQLANGKFLQDPRQRLHGISVHIPYEICHEWPGTICNSTNGGRDTRLYAHRALSESYRSFTCC